MPDRLDIVERLHRRMLEIASTALPLIRGSAEELDLEGLSHLRDDMVHAIASYQVHADHAHAAADESDDLDAIAATDRLRRRCAALNQAYAEFRTRWEHRRAVEHWAEYRLSAMRMMRLIRDHVIAGEQERTQRCAEAVATLGKAPTLPPHRAADHHRPGGRLGHCSRVSFDRCGESRCVLGVVEKGVSAAS